MTKLTAAEYERLPWLMIYGQEEQHDELHIVGTEVGLSRLRDAVDKALSANPAQSVRRAYEKAFTPDGEGYEIAVKLCSRAEMDTMPLPYHRSRQ